MFYDNTYQTGTLSDVVSVVTICLSTLYIYRRPWANGQSFWSDFDRASSLICGNKMPTRCNICFYCRSYCLLNMFRAPLCPSSGAREYYTDGCCLCYLVLWFSICRYGVELRVMCPAAARKPDTQPSAPHHTDNLKTKHQRPQAATNCIILSSSWWWA
jgi:hypothetical protein